MVRQFPAVVITGPRQTGKSTLLRYLFPDYRYITFDDPLILEQALKDPNLLLKSGSEKVILDEIQYMPDILPYLKMRIDADRDKNGRYLLTGSQRFQMIRNLSESLAGRIGIAELMGFDSNERKMKNQTMSPVSEFVNVCIRGCFPQLVTNNSLEPELWYSSYIQTYLQRDISVLYNIGDLRSFQMFTRLLATRCSTVLNYSGIANELGVSIPTVSRWVSILESGRLAFLLPPYYKNLGKRITKSPKIYFTDCGLVSFLTGSLFKDIVLKGPMAGPLFENYVVGEIVKLFLNKGMEPRMFFMRTNNGLEIDLLVETKSMSVCLLEIKLNATPRSAMADSIARFKSLFPTIAVERSFVVCLTERNMVLGRDVDAVSLQSALAYIKDVI